MNWELAFYLALGLMLLGLVGYLELGFTIKRRATEQRDPATVVDDVTVVDVRCADCGRLISLGINVVTGDRVQHISLGQVVAAIGEHRRREHRATA